MKAYLIENNSHKILEFDSIKKLKEWAKKSGWKIKRCYENNWFYTESYVILPTNFD